MQPSSSGRIHETPAARFPFKSHFSSTTPIHQEDKTTQKTETTPNESTHGTPADQQPPNPSQTNEHPEQELTVDELKAALSAAQDAVQDERKKAEDYKEKLVRTLADMENLRDRTARQAAEARQFAVQGLVKSLVEVADNLERAAGSVALTDLDMDPLDGERVLSLLKGLRDGVIMTDSILMKILEGEGVKRYDPMGDPFDPNMHNALFEVPDATKEPGTVAVVVKKGYLLHDRAVRAAEVGVVKSSVDE